MTKYIFASDRIYPVLSSKAPLPVGLTRHEYGGCAVTPDTLVCYDVAIAGTNNFMRADTWEFSVEGFPGIRFRTHYSWALVRDIPLNLAALAAVREKQRAIKALQKEASRLHDTVLTVAQGVFDAAP